MSLPDRIDLIRQSTDVTGIDFIQVSSDQLSLTIFFHHLALPGSLQSDLETITVDDIEISSLSKVEPEFVTVTSINLPITLIDNRPALQIQVAEPGGFGFYQLSINHPSIDTYFNHLPFSFKVNCPSELDCKVEAEPCPPRASRDFPVDYRARDFASFQQVLSDFAHQRYPQWQDRLEADQGVMLMEILSALGDELSYSQDRIKRETNIAEASQRRTLKHFAQLLDYAIDNGAAATGWLDVQVNADDTLAAGTGVTDIHGQVVFEVGQGLSDIGKTFALAVSRNQFSPYIFNEEDTCLWRGSFSLTLSGHHASALLPDANIDPVGKWLLLSTQPAQPDHPLVRTMVRVVDAIEDIDPVTAEQVTEIFWDTPLDNDFDLETLVVRGNLIPITAGQTVPPMTAAPLQFRVGPVTDPASPEADFAQTLERCGANSQLSQKHDAVGRIKHLIPLESSAAAELTWLENDGASQPEIILHDGDGTQWFWLPQFIGEEVATPTQSVFTLEYGSYNTIFNSESPKEKISFVDYASNNGVTIRLGDGEFGKAPARGQVFELRYRLGNGKRTNISRDSILRFVSELAEPPSKPSFVDSVTNPIALINGRDQESMEQIKINLPQAYQAETYRAVTIDDYQTIAERLEWIQQAGASFRWTGSWPTIFVTPDPYDNVGLLPEQRETLQAHLARVRMAGRDVCVKEPRYANVDLEIKVCVAQSAYRGQVKQAVLRTLFGYGTQKGFFDPDNFTFGSALERAQLMSAIQAVAGVKAVNGMRIRRRGFFDWRNFTEWKFSVAVNELIAVANNTLLPERGSVRLIMEGGA
ncbi:MAG: hypothetical protein HWE13_02670 [Gammaproteobacteria bacterium]|nr:hypothetical protein [Gammaproteobacteria bacterium]